MTEAEWLDDLDNRHRWEAHPGKHHYPDLVDALDGLPPNQYVYDCDTCGGFHRATKPEHRGQRDRG